MESINVTTGATAAASQYNLLRQDVISNVSGIYGAAAAASAAGVSLATHKAAAANVHGLGSGINVLGSKQASGLRIEYATGAATWTHVGGQWEQHSAKATWPNAFTNLYAVALAFGVKSVQGAAYNGEVRNEFKSVTACSVTLYIYNAQGETTSMWLNAIGIGN